MGYVQAVVVIVGGVYAWVLRWDFGGMLTGGPRGVAVDMFRDYPGSGVLDRQP